MNNCPVCKGLIKKSDDLMQIYCSKCGLILGELWYFDDVSYNSAGRPMREFSRPTLWNKVETKPLNEREIRQILGHDFAYGYFKRRRKSKAPSRKLRRR